MKIRQYAILSALLVSAVPGLTMAQGPYVGVNYSRLEFVDDGVDDQIIRPDALTVRLGIEPVPWLGLEVRGATGIGEDERRFSGGSLSFELDYLYGAYAKLGLPLGDAVMPYAIAGHSEIKGKATTTVLGVSSSESARREDQSVGAGVDINLSSGLALNLEYMRYLDEADQELSAVSLGVRSAF